MRCRVGTAVSCAVCLLLACGKSEHAAPNVDAAGSSTGGVAVSGNNGDAAGSSVSAGGTSVTSGGRAGSSGSANNLGGEPTEGGAPAAGGEAATGGEAAIGGEASCDGTFRACGCGCCGIASPAPTTTCVYPDLGQSLSQIIAADLARRQDTVGCAAAGCSSGIDYVCCEAPAPMPEQATYDTAVVIGDIGRLRVNKMAANCTTLTLQQVYPANPGPTGFSLETPVGWGIEQATSLPCSSSMTKPRAIGAVGKLSLRLLGNACVLDAHLALFFGDSTTGIEAERLDVDALPIDLPVAECH